MQFPEKVLQVISSYPPSWEENCWEGGLHIARHTLTTPIVHGTNSHETP